jgi:uncharacterized membrane protein
LVFISLGEYIDVGILPVEYGGDGKLPEFDCEKFIAEDIFLNPENKINQTINTSGNLNLDLNKNGSENDKYNFINTKNHDEERKDENNENGEISRKKMSKNAENLKFSLAYS